MSAQVVRFINGSVLEKTMGWATGTLSPVAWLVIQELANGRPPDKIAEGLGASLEDLNEMATEITGESEGLMGEQWRQGVLTVKSVSQMNLATAATGWDAIEAQALNRVGQALNQLGDSLDPMKAIEIAAIANKANRRHLGEGQRGGVSVRMGGGDKESDMDVEIRSGHLGSVKLSLSSRVRAQLETPRVINAQPNGEDSKKMLSLDETRQLVNSGR